MTLVARDETTFGLSEQPGSTVTFKLEQNKATGDHGQRRRQHDGIHTTRGK